MLSWQRGEKARVAQEAGITPSDLSGYIRGIRPMSEKRAQGLEEATRNVLGPERCVPKESWLMRDRFPHPMLAELEPAREPRAKATTKDQRPARTGRSSTRRRTPMIAAKGRYMFTSESVTEGHPDKVADQISDAVLDCLLAQDPDSRVACETLVTTGMAFIAGEITTQAYADLPAIVRETIRDIGYTSSHMGFDADTCAVISSIDKQSPDIAQGVGRAKPEDQGAGDQGMMFGFAVNETPTLMPAPIYWAHKLSRRLTYVRKQNILDFLRPDGKTQVAIEFEDGKPVRIDNVVVSCQHSPNIEQADLVDAVRKEVVYKTLPEDLIDDKLKIYINTTGRFVIGGPMGDCGLTGRKIIQDTYGGMGAHGGGAFSGKDPSKVDRSAAYMARYVAKNVVASGLAEKCQVQIAYCIGVADPVSVLVSGMDTGVVSDQTLTKAVREVFDLRPYFIIDRLKLKRPIYRKSTNYGHFGREDPDFTWEQSDAVDDLRTACKI
ncbi:S-adenosylmethionine synthase [Desulfocurvibacter africanus subsp. africanus str. Walvis Bay]|uniref:S-adenosylmethionine synthase n=2 Tax=Desulfocurvibacter africanus TaxID=873 RepID=F3YXP0_DESAF|nr:S-adenosylmethionine synthase [Desulfocurvibacter africanus subsp. africanus str. Walvis Bay]